MRPSVQTPTPMWRPLLRTFDLYWWAHQGSNLGPGKAEHAERDRHYLSHHWKSLHGMALAGITRAHVAAKSVL